MPQRRGDSSERSGARPVIREDSQPVHGRRSGSDDRRIMACSASNEPREPQDDWLARDFKQRFGPPHPRAFSARKDESRDPRWRQRHWLFPRPLDSQLTQFFLQALAVQADFRGRAGNIPMIFFQLALQESDFEIAPGIAEIGRREN